MKKLVLFIRNKIQKRLALMMQNPDQIRVRIINGACVVTIRPRSDFRGFLKVRGLNTSIIDQDFYEI